MVLLHLHTWPVIHPLTGTTTFHIQTNWPCTPVWVSFFCKKKEFFIKWVFYKVKGILPEWGCLTTCHPVPILILVTIVVREGIQIFLPVPILGWGSRPVPITDPPNSKHIARIKYFYTYILKFLFMCHFMRVYTVCVTHKLQCTRMWQFHGCTRF